jgi:peptide-methionine (S)-S-oxide reductase
MMIIIAEFFSIDCFLPHPEYSLQVTIHIQKCGKIDKSNLICFKEMSMSAGLQDSQIATLGGGCFWCLEAVFDDLKGVLDVVSGYSGGTVPNPSYQVVCTGGTGHAEVVQVRFDPSIISYSDLLRVFFTIHDPTTLNRQGGDIGTQYRSVIFYHDEEQKQFAAQVMAEIEAAQIWDQPVVTQIEPCEVFYPAEDYHQEYFTNNLYQPYCQIVIAPKVAKFRKQYRERLKK